MEKYYYKTKGQVPWTECLEPCLYGKGKDGTMIGSVKCQQCEHNIDTDASGNKEWIKCQLMEDYKDIELPKDANGKQVKIGDKVHGEGNLKCWGNFKIDLSPVVTVNVIDGVLYFGQLSAKSFRQFWIVD